MCGPPRHGHYLLVTEQVLLLNLTSDPVFITDGVRLVRLPEGPTPRAVESSDKNSDSLMSVSIDGIVASLRVVDMLCPMMKAPPVAEGVIWLVPSDVLSQFPERSDFVRPALYSMVPTESLVIESRDVDAVRNSEVLPGNIMVLSAVTRTRQVTSKDSVDISRI